MSSVKQTRFMSFVFLSLPSDNVASLSGDERCALVFSCSVFNAILSIFFAEMEHQLQRLPRAGIAYKFRGNVQRAPMWDQSQECQAK